MRQINKTAYLSLPRWEQIPLLVHGFGMTELTSRGLTQLEELKGFQPVFLRQIHSAHIHTVCGGSQESIKGDALVTSCPGRLLVIKTADCLPVFIIHESRRVAAAVHCGWRGIASRILQGVLLKLDNEFGCPPDELQVAFGPCIRQECYKVGQDVFDEFRKEGLAREAFKKIAGREEKYLLDLRKASRRHLLGLGVRREGIAGAFPCSHCDDRFFSFRRDPKKKGRMMNFVGWRK